MCSFLPKGPRPHLTVHRFGTHRRSPQCNFDGGRISGLQSLRDVQAPLLARPPGCTYRGGVLAPEQPGPLPHAMNIWLPIMNCDIATCPNRAIDTVGLSPTGLRPCRPLPDCRPSWTLRLHPWSFACEGTSCPCSVRPCHGMPCRSPPVPLGYLHVHRIYLSRVAISALQQRQA